MQRNYKYNQRTLNEIGYARIVDAGPRNIAINSVYNRGIYCKTTQRRRSAVLFQRRVLPSPSLDPAETLINFLNAHVEGIGWTSGGIFVSLNWFPLDSI